MLWNTQLLSRASSKRQKMGTFHLKYINLAHPSSTATCFSAWPHCKVQTILKFVILLSQLAETADMRHHANLYLHMLIHNPLLKQKKFTNIWEANPLVRSRRSCIQLQLPGAWLDIACLTLTTSGSDLLLRDNWGDRPCSRELEIGKLLGPFSFLALYSPRFSYK